MASSPSLWKLIIALMLGFATVFLTVLVLTLQVQVMKYRGPAIAQVKVRSETIEHSEFPNQNSFHFWKQYGHITTHPTLAGKAYWDQAVGALQKWDASLEAKRSLSFVNDTVASRALQEASKLGHSDAQFYVANAMASGIWPLDDGPPLEVVDDVMASTAQTTEAHILWRMSAMDGNVDSAVALGYRTYDLLSGTEACQAALPYYEAAANGILDQLEATSRAKISPPMDLHVLPQIHMHGGTSSQLSHHNKPDESAEALQYYHLRATMKPDPDVNAAFTLGHLYHFGHRGVQQNSTLAVKYYQIAADHNHWESSGLVGTFYFWALGVERDLVAAHQYFRKGAPGELSGCTERLNRRKKKKNKQNSEDDYEAFMETEIHLCDHYSVNGLGLVHFFGIPHVLPVNMEKAQQFFKLAKQMGNTDAAYNLAMMNLGLREYDEPAEGGESPPKGGIGALGDTAFGPSKSNVASAVNDLGTAASKGHIQARHRLATMLRKGVTVQVNGVDNVIVAPECNKALAYFKQIVDQASPSLSQWTRKAYKSYMAGDYESSLRNYLAAAELGHEVAQVNAAFLLEQGTCLGLSPTDCAKASVRMYKAAAKKGLSEACLRVGDFYFYRKMRDDAEQAMAALGPLPWLQYFVYPEKLIPHVREAIKSSAVWINSQLIANEERSSTEASSEGSICEESEDGLCEVTGVGEPEDQQSTLDNDMELAARYYRIAAEKHNSPRANYNLGYMHQWGLGLTQDFPLAKRHYDLASPKGSNMKEGEMAVQLALIVLNMHESFVKAQVAWEDWFQSHANEKEGQGVPSVVESSKVGHPVPRRDEAGNVTTAVEVILSHVISWESLLIVILTIVLSKLVQHRRTRAR